MKCLDVPFFKQTTGFSCGPAALRMVLAYYNREVSEKDLIHLLDTTSEEGTRRVHMREIANELGLYCYVNNEAVFEEFSFFAALKVPVVVRFLETTDNEDHYGVVIGATRNEISVHDPWNGPNIHFSEEDFASRWTCDVIGDCDKWLMAVSSEPLPMGKEYNPT